MNTFVVRRPAEWRIGASWGDSGATAENHAIVLGFQTDAICPWTDGIIEAIGGTAVLLRIECQDSTQWLISTTDPDLSMQLRSVGLTPYS